MNHVEWSKSAVIYELNIRQFSKEGTFKAATKELVRLRDLGIQIVWLMPIFPIGMEDRKGTLGSYYSVRDYKDINPEFGNLADFKDFVNNAHALGLKVIIDWVANHTSRDAVWTTEHPEWYRWENGRIVAPYDWTDVAQLDVWNRDMWQAMAEAMQYWLVEANIDGFRCDMASLLPVDFWNFIRSEIDKVKTVFMLAESEDPALHQFAFDATYCWELLHVMDGIARGRNTVDDLTRYFSKNASMFSQNCMRMAFTSNHDENSWSGSEFERMGIAARQMAAFTYIIPGIPLIYNGQEVAHSSRLSFFEKDCIEWGVNLDFTSFYQRLNGLKKQHKCLWNAEWGGDFKYYSDLNRQVLWVERRLDTDMVIGIFNFSPISANITIPGNAAKDAISQTLYPPNKQITLSGFQFLLLTNE